MNFEDLTEDVYGAATAVRKRSGVGKIGLMGHSFRGILAVMVAAVIFIFAYQVTFYNLKHLLKLNEENGRI
jgi:hypothetical protein